jgi:hypothetical protein
LLRQLLFVLVPAWFVVTADAALHVAVPERSAKEDHDVRWAGSNGTGGTNLRFASKRQLLAADELKKEIPGLSVQWSSMSGAPRWLSALAGKPISAPREGSSEAIARAFLDAHFDLFGLSRSQIDELELTSSVPAPGGGSHVYFLQRVGGIEVYGGRANLTLRSDGAVLWIAAELYSEIDRVAQPTLSSKEATTIAARDVYPDLIFDSSAFETTLGDRPDGLTLYEEDEFGVRSLAQLAWFPERVGSRLAWQVRVAEPSRKTEYRVLVDAADGRILTRHNLTSYASARVLTAHYPDPEAEEYSPPQHQVVGIPASTPSSPRGWFAGGETALSGNNAVAHLGHQGGPVLSDPTGSYDYPFNTDRSALVNAWYWINDAHDRFYALGFDEPSGNFQQDNFGSGGVGGDAVEIALDPLEGPPFFSSGADGVAPVLSFGWLNDCRFCADHDGFPENGGDRSYGFMRDVLFHEYAHGVTRRRVGGPADDTCLVGWQSKRMAEGWSDLFAASFFDHPRYGEYTTLGQGWLRDPRHDLLYGDPSGSVTVYDLLWSGVLWDLRESMIALDPEDGLFDFHRLVMESLAIVPCMPTMLDGRDAILAADTLLYGSSHHAIVWSVFAARGMGALASTTGANDSRPTPDFSEPDGLQCTAPETPLIMAVTVDDDNAVVLDYEAVDAAAIEIWREDLDNPADAPEHIAFTTQLSSYIDTTVQGGKRYRYHLVALGDGGIRCRSPRSISADVTAMGNCDEEFPIFVPRLAVVDGASTCAVTLTWDAASPACPGSTAPITYNVYRFGTPGFLPSDLLLVGRTSSTSFTDVPIESEEPEFPTFADLNLYNFAPYYLVLAQHGTLNDPPDHRDRGRSQVIQWMPGLPTLGRTTVAFWDFESGAQGWTRAGGNNPPPDKRWIVTSPGPTYYGGTLNAPDEASGGSGKAWVTGDAAAGPSTIVSHSCSGDYLITPVWDASGGATILSFDYWATPPWGAEFWGSAGIYMLDPQANEGVDIGLLTTQRFLGPGRYGWQHAELDISRFAEPRSTMQLYLGGFDCLGNAEFGIDNVRIERATVCSVSALRLHSVTVDDTASGYGNGNGVLEPGEIARLYPELRNEGSTNSPRPVGRILTRAPGAVILDDAATFGDVAPSGTGGVVDDGFAVALPATGECDGTVVFELVFVDESGVRSTALWEPEWGTTQSDVLFEDDFETDKGWVTSGAGAGQGMWQRGEPVGTFDGSYPANPDMDSPFDLGGSCYVTENGPTVGSPSAHDVDPGAVPRLVSPPVSVTGYKRVFFGYDAWRYDDPWGPDFGLVFAAAREDGSDYPPVTAYSPTDNSWTPVEVEIVLDQSSPVERSARLTFWAVDKAPDEVVEGGVDNVRVVGVRQECAPSGLHPPNAVGDTVRLGKTGSSVRLSWAVPAVDATHDQPVYYPVYVSNTPQGVFSIQGAPTAPLLHRSLDLSTEFYLVVAANGGGTSGEEPPP